MIAVDDGRGSSGQLILEGTDLAIGDAETRTIFTNHFTEGGEGSGGGAGLGGVFFIDQGASLTLDNVSFIGNTVKGGEGGSTPAQRASNILISLTEQAVKLTDVFAPASVTDRLTFDGDDYFIDGVDLVDANPLIGEGAPVTLGDAGSGAVGAINGASLDFDVPVAVAAGGIAPGVVLTRGGYDDVFAPLMPFEDIDAAVDQDFWLDGNRLVVADPSAVEGVEAGMTVAVTTPTGRDFFMIEQVVVSGGAISELVLDAPIDLDGVAGRNSTIVGVNPSNPLATVDSTVLSNFDIDIIKVNDATASQFRLDGAGREVTITGKVAGLREGMELSGEGIPGGVFIDAIDEDASGNLVLALSSAIPPTVTAFDAVRSPAKIGSPQINLLGARNDLEIGQIVENEGAVLGSIIAIDGDVITLDQNLAAVPESLTIRRIDAAAGLITVRGGAGLDVRPGMLITGPGIDDPLEVIGVSRLDGTLSISVSGDADQVGDSFVASSALSTGGSMNGVASGGRGNDGRDGRNASPFTALLQDGEGGNGFDGSNAGPGDGGAGGKGGDGGNGTDGLPFNRGLFKDQIDAVNDVIDLTGEVAGSFGTFPPDIAEATGNTVSLALSIVTLVDTTISLVNWTEDLFNGRAGTGGEGGAGGDGGDGDDFFGGGAGGTGGAGGLGALPFDPINTQGGVGGSGGGGGNGGFGAGGGAGGAAGESGLFALEGDSGDGGLPGFGGGEGSNGEGVFGGGGSGFGGALFVREGGALVITGDSLFRNNTVLAGSSNNFGEAGEAAGADLFAMAGSTVELRPGVGNVIRFEGGIADNSAESYEGANFAAGAGADLRIGGVVLFSSWPITPILARRSSTAPRSRPRMAPV